MAEEEREVDVSRRDLGALLGVLGGAAGLAALASCASADGTGTSAEGTARAVEAVSGTSVVWFNTINGPCTNGSTYMLDTAGPPSAYQVAVVFGFNSPGDGGGGVFYWDYASTATADGGTIFPASPPPVSNICQPPTTTGRWVRIYSGPLDVRWFGAVGNANYYDSSNGKWYVDSAFTTEATDDAPAIAAAMTKATALAVGTSTKTVVIPPGAYYLKTTSHSDPAYGAYFFQIASDVSVEGSGNLSSLRCAPGLDGSLPFNVFFTNGDVSNVSFRGLRIDRNPKNSATGGTHNGFLIGIVATGAATSNINIDSCRFENANCWNPVLIGNDPNSASNVRVTNCTFIDIGQGMTDHSSLWVQANGAVIADNIFLNSPTNTTSRTVGCAMEIHGQGISVTGNVVTNENGAVVVSVGSTVSTRSVVITGNVFGQDSGSGTFTGVTTGIAIFPNYSGSSSLNISNLLISGNSMTIQSNGVQAEAGVQMAFGTSSFAGIDQLCIEGNLFEYVSSGLTVVQPFGVAWTGNIKSATIRANRFHNFLNGGIQIDPQAYPANSSSPGNRCYDVKIEGNHLTDCATATNGVIQIIGNPSETGTGSSAVIQRIDITNNTIVDNQSMPTTRNGIAVENSVDSVTISNNIIRNVTTALGFAGPTTNMAIGTQTGSATLSAGAVTVSSLNITSNARITLSYNTVSGTPGTLSSPASGRVVGQPSGSGSFQIKSSSSLDNSTVDYVVEGS